MNRALLASLVFLFAGCASEPTPGERAAAFRAALDEGDRKLGAGDAIGAVDAYGRAAEIDPGSALAWFRRGEAKSAAGDNAGAAEDFGIAIKLNLNDSLPWFRRARARQAQGDYAGAIDDYSRALQVRTESAYLRGRGHSKFCAGDLDGAIADLDEAAHVQGAGSDRDFLELELSAFLIRDGRRVDALKRLREHFAAAPPSTAGAWPRQLAEFLVGDLPEPDLMLMARSGAGQTRRERLCEASFYAAIIHAANSDESRAVALLRDCVENAVPGFVEPEMARAELKRLER